MKERLTILAGDWVEQLRTLPDECVQCCVTSPPYWGLRDYGIADQLGLEKTPGEYVSKLVEGFREVRRGLKQDGTLWLNLGDSYAGGGNYRGLTSKNTLSDKQASNRGARGISQELGARGKEPGCKPKDLIGVPWRVAFALREDGWWLRSDIIWAKPNCMPESVRDRPTRSHEYIFLLSKRENYFYDQESILEPSSASTQLRLSQDVAAQQGSLRANGGGKTNGPMKAVGRHSRRHDGFNTRWDLMEKEEQCGGMRNKRDVWWVAPACFAEAHFATFPPDLIKPCILAGSKAGDTVLDPFFGSGTTGAVALELGRKCIGIELNPDYIELAKQRCDVTPGLSLFPK